MYAIDSLTTLFLGEQYEQLAQEIRVDMSTWLSGNDGLRCYILALRHGEQVPYTVATTTEENVLVWPVTSYDNAIRGAGLCMFVATDGTRIIKSKRIRTEVDSILPGSEEEESPEPIRGWIAQMLADVTDIYNAAVAAKTAAETAQAGAETAAGSASQDAGQVNQQYQAITKLAQQASDSAAAAAEESGNAADEADAAATSAELARQYAEAAEAGALTHGVCWFEINEQEHVIWHVSTTWEGAAFYIKDGRMFMTYVD